VFARYQRHDGLFLALLGADGAVLEERALLYDQAFALLALAAAHGVLGASAGCAARAAALWECITGSLRAPLGFRADSETAGPLLANPHMHLLEALLAWADIDDPPRWRRRAEAVVTLADLTVLDPEARLWPQTERVKTLARLARLTGEVRCWGGAAQAAEALRAYFTMARGLWYDRRMPDGSFVPEPSPASSFYHIVGAIDALGRALGER
jgi:mannose/cellobiose epimerase-like protein (N-acyl-D-glucosamine 2-epimerase family)